MNSDKSKSHSHHQSDQPAEYTPALKHTKPNKAELEREKVRLAHAALAGIDDHDWTDTGMADRVLDRHGAKMRFVVEQHKAYTYLPEKGIWEADSHCHMLERLIEETILYSRDVLATHIADPEARSKYQLYLQMSLSRRARGDALHILLTKLVSVSVNDFDADPVILCVRNGLIDLTTSELTPHRPDALCTKQINLDYDPEAVCPKFMDFTHWTMGGGPDASPEAQSRAEMLVEFKQRLYGCCATGIYEKMIVFFHGKKGNNGKSVELDLVRMSIGPYSGPLQIEALCAAKGEISNNLNSNIMKLKGVRMAVSSEPEQDRALNISRIKYMTGGGYIMARSLHMDPVEFKITFKSLVELNYLMRITNADDPVWNRIWCIPFVNQISEEKKDPRLREKLETELPGILAWIVRGAAIYLQSGLDFPKELSILTQEYKTVADHFPLFIEDCVERDETAHTALDKTRSGYEAWTLATGETALNRNEFKSRLQQLGFEQFRVRVSGRQFWAWKGLKLVSGRSMPINIGRNL